MRRPLRVASDCSGINSPWFALQRLGVSFTEVWYSDICPHARRVSELNRLEQNEPCIDYGDIMERDFDEIAQHDVQLYVSGPPCQSFSCIGKRAGAQDPRFDVFLNVLDTILHCEPQTFIVENVAICCNVARQQIDHKLSLLSEYNIHKDHLTAAMWSPQNRMRLYIVGIRRDVQQQPFQFPTPPQQRLCTLDDVL